MQQGAPQCRSAYVSVQGARVHYLHAGTGRPLHIVQSQLGDDAILMGGLWLILDRLGQLPAADSDIKATAEKSQAERAAPERLIPAVDKPLEVPV